MRCLVALDGLAESNLPDLLRLMPRFQARFKRLKTSVLEFSSSAPQSAWSEILTGTKTFDNGCAGYAHPSSSLNKSVIFTETDLLKPPFLVEADQGSAAVAINIPLLLPKPGNRIWLSDGSLPINKFVSPSSLRSHPAFAQYEPRPYKSHAGASTVFQRDLLRRCVDVEAKRLACALSLFKSGDWSTFVYRITLFDHLFHLIGLNFLQATDLSIYGALKSFLAELDEAIEIFSSDEAVKTAFVSAYSHVACLGTLNLNMVLAQGNYLKLADEESASRTHADRVKVASALWETTTHYLSTLEGRLLTSATIAASPVAGAIYMNKSAVFVDGIVDKENYKKLRSDVALYLHNFLSAGYNRPFNIEIHPAEYNDTLAPDIVVSVDGIEFHNLGHKAITPRTTHKASGFALLPERFAVNNITATKLASWLLS
ncbi:MAG TPA: hypothetical protein V6C89_09495 [Drouetiella sp.]|jgi:hypothetical protein